MPYLELLLHLNLTGDGIVTQHDGRLRTERGHEYVRSQEGWILVHGENPRWEPKYIWCRV